MDNRKNNSTSWFKTIKRKNVKICGIASELIPDQETGLVLQKAIMTSQETRFFKYAENICKLISNKSYNNLLVIIDKNENAKIYEEAFPLSMKQRLKRSVKKGELIYKKDVLDISEVSFSDAKSDINPKDGEQIIWLFRIGFVFGLYFDFTKQLKPEIAKVEMAHLYQKVMYNDLYNTLDDNVCQTLFNNGWFPFIQLIGKDMDLLFSIFIENKTHYLSKWCEKSFTNERIKEITSRWWNYEVFLNKKNPIQEGLECFYEGKYSASISTLIPMIEGVVNSLSIIKTGKGIKYNGKDVTKIIGEYSSEKYTELSITFPKLFSQYLNDYFYKHNKATESNDAVRNTVSHGRSTNDSFSRENAVKIILTLDQIFFYL